MFLQFVLALGFGNLAMLGWLAAAAAPLLIHLWSRRKHQQVPWAAVTFLRAAMRRSARRIQIQQWLLLAARTAIIVLVVLAIAEPFGAGTLADGPTGAPAHKVLVLDASFSMACRDEEVSRFARAKLLAAQLVRDSGAADRFTVILMARPARTIVKAEIADSAAVIAQIESLTQPHTGADLAATLALIEESISDREREIAIQERAEVYIFTDLQRGTWVGATSPAPEQSEPSMAEDTTHARLVALARRAACVIVDIGTRAVANRGVTRLTAPGPFVTTRGDTALEVSIRQFGDPSRDGSPSSHNGAADGSRAVVELLVDGVTVAEQTLDLPAGSEATARFTHRFRSSGRHVVAARTAGDSLDVDNARWLVIPVRDEVRVLCAEGKPGAAKYVADALDPDASDASTIRPVVVTESDFAEVDLATFDCLFLCNIAQLTTSEAERLQRYASAGGGIVVLLGDNVRPAAYLAHGDLLPARVGESLAAPSLGLDPLGYRHPIVAVFRGRERSGLVTTPVAKYFRLEAQSSRSDVAVAAALPNGDPFIVTGTLGEGRVVLVATDGSLSSVDAATGEPWTHWPTWPSFLPMIREMLAFAAGGRQDTWQQLVGAPLAVPSGELVEIVRPDGRRVSFRASIDPAVDASDYDATELAGIYTIRQSPSAQPLPVAVNVDPQEGDLTRADPQRLPPEVLVRPAPPAPGASASNSIALRSAWHTPLLWIVLVMMLAEQLLARQFGRGVQ